MASSKTAFDRNDPRGRPPGPAEPSKEFTVKFQQKASSSGEMSSALESWMRTQAPPTAPKNAAIDVKLQPLTDKALATMVDILHSENPPARMVELSVPLETFIGTVVTGLAVLRYVEERGDFGKKGSQNPTSTDEWEKGLAEFKRQMETAGLPIKDRALEQYAAAVTSNDAALSMLLKMSQSAQDEKPLGKSFSASVVPAVQVGAWLPPSPTVFKFCKPITGVFTKHFSHAYQWTISVPWLCGKWWNLHWCYKTVVIATVTVNLDLNVGYKIVNCCSASVWGTANGQVCAGSYCLSCAASITGATTISSSTSGGQCNYAIGISAAFSCKIGSTTLFALSYPIGWNVSGPCSPIPC